MSGGIDHLDFEASVRFIYCDSQGVQSEGARIAGLRPEFAVNEWDCDFGQLVELLRRKGLVGAAGVFGIFPGDDDSMFAEPSEGMIDGVNQCSGPEMKVRDGDHLDLLTIKCLTDADSRMTFDPETEVVTIVAGDRRLRFLIRNLQARGAFVEVAYWTHAVAPELVEVADQFVPLDLFVDHITRGRLPTSPTFRL